ncbi:hypothetical protein Tco_1066498 [Tanacetum coccineum]|uniref:Xylulose kinase-1 n=1 Tax=Tanacetum coccineum TaxID=301880 RepID=A0ABQ5HA95_9ASTR
MATLEFCDKHNMVAYLEKPEGSAEFHQIIDFLTASHIHYALTENPTIYASFIKQFWTTATASTNVNGEVELTASIDGQAKTITEASLRRHLKLEDNGGITSLPNTEIFEQLALMGFNTTAGNPVKKILLKLNLSNHRSILTDLKELREGGERLPVSTVSQRSIATCSYTTDNIKDVHEVK